MGNVFKEYFTLSRGLSSKTRLFLIFQPIAFNQIPNMIRLLFSTLFKVCTDAIKKYKIITDCIMFIFSHNHKRA